LNGFTFSANVDCDIDKENEPYFGGKMDVSNSIIFRKERRPLTSSQCNRKKKLANVKVMAVQCCKFLHVAILQYNAGPSLQVSEQTTTGEPF